MPEGFSWRELEVDPARVHVIKDLPLRTGREFVLYWCMVNHRIEENHALDAAWALAGHLGLPLVVYQALRPDYPYASDRLHGFILDGLVDLQAAYAKRGIPYWLELPKNPREHKKRLGQLGKRAAAVVSDFFPTFVIPGHLRGAARALDVPLFAIDASCVVPMQRIPEPQVGAYALRPKVTKLWAEYLPQTLPKRTVPKQKVPPPDSFEVADAKDCRANLDSFAIDHAVLPVEGRPGGRKAALKALTLFVEEHLPTFGEGRNDPAAEGSSGLSPYFHFGHLFGGEAVRRAGEAVGLDHPGYLSFREQVLVRRELGFNWCFHRALPNQVSFESLPRWSQDTLNAHRKDPRPNLYSDEQLERGQTADEIWNAAQRQLTAEGRIHNYLRMLWGKKILEWSPSPEVALQRIGRLNDTYALDGRDPVSQANFMWILGLHDRPFQERAIIGKVRPMSSDRTRKKFDLDAYLKRYGP